MHFIVWPRRNIIHPAMFFNKWANENIRYRGKRSQSPCNRTSWNWEVILVRAMYDRLRDQGKKVEIVCASGIAGSVYSDKIRTSTVHACYGLWTTDLPSKLVIERAISNNLVEERIKSWHYYLGRSEHVESKSVRASEWHTCCLCTFVWVLLFVWWKAHTCPIYSKCVELSVCIDKSSWQKPCREIHEVILTGSWQTLQEVWLQSQEMVILREWGVEMSSSRRDSTRLVTSRSRLDFIWLKTRLQTKAQKKWNKKPCNVYLVL